MLKSGCFWHLFFVFVERGGCCLPQRVQRLCAYPGCSVRVKNGYCPRHRRERVENRVSAAKRGYDRDWRRYRINFLKEHPWCVECEKQGVRRPATEVDHIIPHRGDRQLFWNKKNHQALCKNCHSRKTAKGL